MNRPVAHSNFVPSLSSQSSLSFPGWEPDGCSPRKGDLAPLVLRPAFDINQVLTLLHIFLCHLTLQPLGVSHHVESPKFSTQPSEKPIITHPVRDQVPQPGDALTSVVISPGDTDLLGPRLFHVNQLRHIQWPVFESIMSTPG